MARWHQSAETSPITKPELSRRAQRPDLTVLLGVYELSGQQSSHCSPSGDNAALLTSRSDLTFASAFRAARAVAAQPYPTLSRYVIVSGDSEVCANANTLVATR